MPDDHDTVGAAALDFHGNVAFATSTGGITAKLPGRVGDSPIVGESHSFIVGESKSPIVGESHSPIVGES